MVNAATMGNKVDMNKIENVGLMAKYQFDYYLIWPTRRFLKMLFSSSIYG